MGWISRDKWKDIRIVEKWEYEYAVFAEIWARNAVSFALDLNKDGREEMPLFHLPKQHVFVRSWGKTMTDTFTKRTDNRYSFSVKLSTDALDNDMEETDFRKTFQTVFAEWIKFAIENAMGRLNDERDAAIMKRAAKLACTCTEGYSNFDIIMPGGVKIESKWSKSADYWKWKVQVKVPDEAKAQAKTSSSCLACSKPIL